MDGKGFCVFPSHALLASTGQITGDSSLFDPSFDTSSQGNSFAESSSWSFSILELNGVVKLKTDALLELEASKDKEEEKRKK